MTIERTNGKHNFSNTIDNYDYVTNNDDYEFIALYEDNYLVTELDKSDVIKLAEIFNVTSNDLVTQK